MWPGWLSLDGIEIANATRTETYLRNAGVEWFGQGYDNQSLPLILGETYASPLQDDAPWVDPDNPASLEFFGFYLTSMKGIEDSTVTSEVIEFLTDGGVPGRPRAGTKPVVGAGLLLASSEAGAEYGMRWLKSAVRGGPCSDNGSGPNPFGSQLCYLSSAPCVEIDNSPRGVQALIDGGDADGSGDYVVYGGDADGSGDYVVYGGDADHVTLVVTHSDELFTVPQVERLDYAGCLAQYQRSLYRFAVIQGPFIDSKMTMSDGGQVWAVQFTGNAGTPYEFGSEVEVLRGFLDPNVADPIVDPDVDYVADLEGFVYIDVDCEQPLWGPLYDPLCPALIAPPAPVDIALSCVTVPSNWQRRQVVIPESVVPLWDDMVPLITLRAVDGDLRTVRLRFYSDPYSTNDPTADPCSYCGDMLVTYVPYQGALVIDGITETIYVDMPGGERRRADSLVVATDGKPFSWPKLSCGFGYVLTLDAPRTQTPPVVDLSLVPRSR